MYLVKGAQLLPFNSTALVGERPRNAGLAEVGGRRFLAYRNGPLGRTIELRLAELDQDWRIIKDLVLLDGAPSYEDPRLSLLEETLWVSYHMSGRGKRSIGIAEVLPDDLNPIGRSWDLPKFQKVEKNWVPLAWDHDDGFFWSYDLNRKHQVKYIVNGVPLQDRQDRGAVEQYGLVRGGTNFIPWSDETLLTIAHSSVLTGPQRKWRQYVAFPVLIRAIPPFHVISTGSLLMAGTRFGTGYPGGKRKAVVFPCGLIRQGSDVVISLGYNDQEVRLAWVPRAVITQALREGPQPTPVATLAAASEEWLQPLT